MSIPRKIHQVHIGPNPIAEREKQWCEQMRTMNPNWEYQLHGNELLEMGRYGQDPYVRHMLLQKASLAFVVDRLRMLLLFDEGGIYLDTDCQPLKPLESLPIWDEPGVEFVFGYRDPYRPGVAVQRGISLIDNSVLASKGSGAVCKKLLNLWRPEEIQVSGHRVGLGILTHADWTCRGLNWRYFYSMSPHPDAIVLHDGHNAGSWVKDKTPMPHVQTGETVRL